MFKTLKFSTKTWTKLYVWKSGVNYIEVNIKILGYIDNAEKNIKKVPEARWSMLPYYNPWVRGSTSINACF